MLFRSLVLTLLIATASIGWSAETEVQYLEEIKPLLRERCFACHGALKQEAGLRLDTAASMIERAAIAPNDASSSTLLERVATADESYRMPPHGQGEPLSPEQVAMLRQWIEQGAAAPENEQPESDPNEHWAFQPIQRPSAPQEVRSPWVRTPIDAFLAQRHRREGLKPQDEASRLTLLRRLHFDLVGVPPSPQDVDRHEGETRPDWLEREMDRLLCDPRHGERWGRHWMDIWRYSDWWGLGQQHRNSQKHIWHWRDWIVESLNKDVGYDEMVRQMLAADELYPNDLDKLRATGYLARNFFLFNRNQWMEETVEHVAKGFLGLTVNCAKCHDHKYDPILQTDFYRLRAFFEPYHVRLEMAPGEHDFSRDGVPRVYDGWLDKPTYRLVRGEEGNFDKSAVMTPAVPDILAFDELAIEPVDLPPQAWQPERRPWVLENYKQARQEQVAKAQTAVDDAREKLARKEEEARRIVSKVAAKSQSSAKEVAETMVSDDFTQLDEKRWELLGGKWRHEPGALRQQQDGPMRASLRWRQAPPMDFDAAVKFTIHGGSRWRSVGLSFDVSDAATATDGELHVYVSAHAGGPKVQAAYHHGGKWHYPPSGRNSQPIETGRIYTLRVQVRGRLINASLDGEPVIAWETPIERRGGGMQLNTFDALASVHEINVAALDPKASLYSPGGLSAAAKSSPQSAQQAIERARAEVKVAQASLDLAIAESESLARRAGAMQAQWANEKSAPDDRFAAVRAQRRAAAAKAEHEVAAAELALLRAAADKKNAAKNTLKAARETLKNAKAAAQAEVKSDDQFERPIGAKWTPTRFQFSGRDDAAVEFPQASTGRRTALARWLTDHRNPLPARVAANHLWTRHVGSPLVPTMFDFGRNGTPPAYPELLDWLAAELIDSGWSMKRLHRAIVTSTAYRMDSSLAGREPNRAVDPDNRLLWRRTPTRLRSQAVRDAVLALAGNLDLAMGGPPVPSNQQEASKRRSLYFFHSKNERNRFLLTFDEARVTDCYRREQSIKPQQALALTNSKLVLDACEPIAQRLSKPTSDDASFIRRAFQVLLGIDASDEEIAASQAALNAWRKLPDGSPENARSNFVWALINHNDFVTIR